MSPIIFGVIILSVIVAYILKSITGFGTSLILVPVLSAIFGIKEAVVLAALGDVVSSAILAYRDGHHASLVKIKELGIGLLIGTVVGVGLLNTVNPNILRQLLAVFIIVYLIIQQLNPTIKNVTEPVRKVLAYALGFIGGVCGGVFNTNGPALFVYVRSFFPSRESIRANIILLFLIDSLWRTSLMAINGLVSLQLILTFSLLMLPTLLLGLYIGNRIDKKLHSKHYTFISKAVLMISGFKLLLAK